MMEDTYGHTPPRKAFELGDVYAVAKDEERARRKPLSIGFIGPAPWFNPSTGRQSRGCRPSGSR